MRHHLLVLVAACGLAASQGALAQFGGVPVGASPGDWEFRIGPVFTESKGVNFNGGSHADLDSTTGVKIGTGWYVLPQLAIGMNFAWAQSSFNGTVKGNTSNTPGAPSISTQIENGHVDFSTLNFDAIYTFLDGPIKPLLEVGIGWNWLNTNIASGPPQTGCWWDPWWGYICSGYQPTHGSSSFTYQVGGGVQFNFSRSFAIDADYRYTWYQLDHSSGTPALGTVELMFIWRFPGGHY